MRSFVSFVRALTGRRDFYAGGLMVLVGCGVASKGFAYHIGTLRHIGPGFFPTALGVILALLGIAIAATASTATPASADSEHIVGKPAQWWSWFCILAGPILFILCGRFFGMIPGTFACVFVSALGDRTATWKTSLVLAIVVTALGVGLFAYFLQVPMPILTWKAGW